MRARDDARQIGAREVSALVRLPELRQLVELERIGLHALAEVFRGAHVADLREARARLTLPVHRRLGLLEPAHQRVTGARIAQLAQHVHDLLGAEPLRLFLLIRANAVEREHEALAADAVAQGLEELLSVLGLVAAFVGLVGVGERLEQGSARGLVADLPEAVRGLATHVGIGVLHELDQHGRPFALRVAREHRGHELPHRGALVVGELGELVERHEAGEQIRVEGRPTAEALDLAEEAHPVSVHGLLEHGWLAQRHQRPHDLRAIAVIGALQRLEQRGLAHVALGRSVVGEHLRAHATHAMIRLRHRLGRERGALGIFGPRELDQRLLLEHRLAGVAGPFLPARHLVLLRQDEDVLLLLADLLDGHLLVLGADAEVDGRRRADHEEQPDEDGDGAEATALEVAIVRVAAASRSGRACREIVVVRRELREEDAGRKRLFPVISGAAGRLSIEHGSS
jgi:hypothetical protein